MQIMLPKIVGAPSSEVVEIISDTEIRVKKEFGGERGTAKIRAALEELEVRPGWSGALASAHSRVTECAGG